MLSVGFEGMPAQETRVPLSWVPQQMRTPEFYGAQLDMALDREDYESAAAYRDLLWGLT